MNEKDIKAILWLLEEINKDKIIVHYFRHQLNLHNTDIVKLINQFKDMVKMFDNPMVNEIDVPIMPMLKVYKE